MTFKQLRLLTELETVLLSPSGEWHLVNIRRVSGAYWEWVTAPICILRIQTKLSITWRHPRPSIKYISSINISRFAYTGWPKKNGRFFFLGLYSDQQLSFFTLLDRTYFPYYNYTKIVKFGWELFILWVITYGLSFSGFAINLSLIVPRNSGNRANPKNDSP